MTDVFITRDSLVTLAAALRETAESIDQVPDDWEGFDYPPHSFTAQLFRLFDTLGGLPGERTK